MRDRPLILGGLALFLVLITFPIWYNLAAGTAARPPEIKRPAEEKNCVAATAYMRTSHMELLTAWRDQVVRQDIRTFTALDGRTYTMALTQTCLKCHASKADFCDRCHAYAGVAPHCWSCHVDPKESREGKA